MGIKGVASTFIAMLATLSALALLAACGQDEPVSPPAQRNATPPAPLAAPDPPLTREQVIEARRKFQVEVIDFNVEEKFGVEFPYSNYVRLRVTNGSDVTLPTLTVLTKRIGHDGKQAGASRNPKIPVADLKPGQTAEFDFYPKGHLPYMKGVTVEIEDLIPPDVEQFFPELP